MEIQVQRCLLEIKIYQEQSELKLAPQSFNDLIWIRNKLV